MTKKFDMRKKGPTRDLDLRCSYRESGTLPLQHSTH